MTTIDLYIDFFFWHPRCKYIHLYKSGSNKYNYCLHSGKEMLNGSGKYTHRVALWNTSSEFWNGTGQPWKTNSFVCTKIICDNFLFFFKAQPFEEVNFLDPFHLLPEWSSSAYKMSDDNQTALKSYNCSLCSKTFKSERNLRRHLQTHQSHKYTCDVCNKSYASRSGLATHRQIHSGKKKHECQKCNMCFFSKSKLERHEIKHYGTKYFKCHICLSHDLYSQRIRSHDY